MYFTTIAKTVSKDVSVQNVLNLIGSQEAINYIEKNISMNDLETNFYERKYFETNEQDAQITLNQMITLIKFNDHAIATVIETTLPNSNEKQHSVDLDHIIFENGLIRKQLVSFYNGKQGFTVNNPSEVEKLTLPVIVTDSEEDVHAKYLSCFTGGCCKLDGTQYRWCGMNCGSGVPVNSLDTCCRTHDYCYDSFSSYPTRCTCDRNLINCAKATNIPGRTEVVLAFEAKMAVNFCWL